jgi:hypothetical protein
MHTKYVRIDIIFIQYFHKNNKGIVSLAKDALKSDVYKVEEGEISNMYYREFAEWIENYDLGKLLIIDVNNLDFVKNVEDHAYILEQVDLEVNGLFS